MCSVLDSMRYRLQTGEAFSQFSFQPSRAGLALPIDLLGFPPTGDGNGERFHDFCCSRHLKRSEIRTMIEILGKPTLPDFVIIGAQKCGTTSLLSYIGQHSRVRLARKKAIHFFDYNYERGGTWYARQFPRSAVFPFRGGEGKRNWLTGESCPSYVFLPEVPSRMKGTVPDAKVIVVLRDPVKRLVSHYFHERRKQRPTPVSSSSSHHPLNKAGLRAVRPVRYWRRLPYPEFSTLHNCGTGGSSTRLRKPWWSALRT